MILKNSIIKKLGFFTLFILIQSVISFQGNSEYFSEEENNPIEELYFKVNSTYMKEVISDIMDLLDSYVFYDILQNPPEPYTKLKVDLKKEFDNIDISEEKSFYEFYREIKKIIPRSADSAFDILGNELIVEQKIIPFQNYRLCLPFKFYLDYKKNDSVKMYIKEYSECVLYYDNNIKEFIKNHENISLDEINGKDAFDFIQALGSEFYQFKNKNSFFNYIMDTISDFYLKYIPILPEEINSMNLLFNDNETLDTSFYLIKSKDNETLNKSNVKELNWTYQTTNSELKCRFDEKYNLNVLFLNSFNIDEDDIQTIFNCARLFFTNKYEIVVIGKQILEGENLYSYILTQILQPKIDFKLNFAMRQSELNRLNFESKIEQFLDVETCRPFKSWNDFIQSDPDKYDDIEHKRTKIYNPISKSWLMQLNEIRKEFKSKGMLKKPTEILILTDTLSFGSGSTFIKNLQINGAAIIASYAGNPFNEETNLDASLDPCEVTKYEGTDIYNKLLKNGFNINKIPFAESFETTKDNQIPLAFKVNQVDEKTNIYHSYEDKYYDEFIKEAKNIFKKYNEDSKCNPNNLNLLSESDVCSNPDENSYGGHVCNETGEWGDQCQIFYCDIGYYYNKLTKKCEIDLCVNYETIVIDEEMDEKITIKKDKFYIFTVNTNLYAYSFKSAVDDIIYYPDLVKCSKFCVVQKPSIEFMYVNYYQNLEQDTEIIISAKKANEYIVSYKLDSPKMSYIEPISGTNIYIFQLTDDNTMYIDSYEQDFHFFYALYDEKMTLNDIIKVNETYFQRGAGQIMTLPKNNIYIGVFIYSISVSFSKIYFYNSLPPSINIKNGNMPLLYFEPGITYELNLEENTMAYMLKLNPKTDANIEIIDDQGNVANLTLSNKYYFSFTQSYSGKLTLITDKSAMVEILYSFGEENTDYLRNTSINYYDISKEITIIEYSPVDDNKILKIDIESDYDFNIGVYAGLSKGNFVYYSQSNYPPKSKNLQAYSIKFDNPLEGIELKNNETYIICLMFNKSQLEKKISMNIEYTKNDLDILFEPLEESYVEEVINKLETIIENYIYLEIARAPPEIEGLDNYTHSPIDLIGDLKKIEKKNRTYYELFKDIRKVTGTVRDLHLKIYAVKTPKGISLDKTQLCLPFQFYVDTVKIDNKEVPKVFIKLFPICSYFYKPEIREFLNKKCNNVIVESINGKDPFEFIQNWGRDIRGTKSPHGHFTYAKNSIHGFNLMDFPISLDDFKVELKFEDSDILNLEYNVFLPPSTNMKEFLSRENINHEEFDRFYTEEMKKYKYKENKPMILELIKEYKQMKGILKKEPEEDIILNDIEWNYTTTEENGIKCRVDNLNQMNVILQGTFGLDYDNAFEVISKCMKAFYQNNYRIIVIENLNGGGQGLISFLFSQLLQVKIQQKFYYASKQTNMFKEWIQQIGYTDTETCENITNVTSFMNGKTYNYGNIIGNAHRRTKMFDLAKKDDVIKITNIREKLLKQNLKNPTDIIIFTDSFAYSSTGLFIKSLQYSGGAITVGFNGNPFLSDKEFDAGQAPSPTNTFEDTKDVQDLESLGFIIGGLTWAEQFNHDYPDDKSMPLEYQFYPVDERVNIYDSYSDDKYDVFIEKAKEIFKKYNDNGECNANNQRLFLENDTECYKFEDDEHAHGGYVCGADGKWTKICKKYYCDIGYYYNRYEGKCLPDPCLINEKVKDIYLNDFYEETIILNKSNNAEYVFHLQSDKYLYFFQANIGGYFYYDASTPCPSLLIWQKKMSRYQELHLNPFKNAIENEVIVKITSIKDIPGYVQCMKFTENILEDSSLISEKNLLILEGDKDYILYAKKYDKSLNYYYTEYNDKMTISDIVNINKSFYKKVNNKIVDMKVGKVHIIAYEPNNPQAISQILIQPKNIDKNVQLNSNYLFLSRYLSKQDYEYTFNFENNNLNRIIRLSEECENCEILLKNEQTKEEQILNSTYSYYTFNNESSIFKGNLTIKVINGEGALIESLFAYDENNFDILKEEEFSTHRLLKPTIIKFEEKKENTSISIIVNSTNKNKFNLFYLTGYSKGNYFHIPEIIINPYISNINSYEVKLLNEKDILEKDESFYTIIYIPPYILNNNSYNIEISKKEGPDDEEPSDYESDIGTDTTHSDTSDSTDTTYSDTIHSDISDSTYSDLTDSTHHTDNTPQEESTPEESGLQSWHIALIAVGGVLVIVIILLVLFKFVIQKGKNDTDITGSLVDSKESQMKELTETN